jgi:hypothetical protein
MADIVNLNRAKKAKAKAAAEKTADANRALHGTPKALRRIEKLRGEKAARDIDGHRLDDQT